MAWFQRAVAKLVKGDVKKKEPCNRRTFIIGGMCLVVMVLYTQRTTLSVSVVDMELALGWSDAEKDAILSSFYWGYTGFMLPSGVLVNKFGGHAMLTFACFASSTLTLLLPTVASSSGFGAVCFLRAMTGIVEAACYPATYDVISCWIPADEKSTAIGLGMAFGEQLGAVVGFGVTGILCDQIGWRSPFYFFGSFGVFIALFWATLCSRDPLSDRFIHNEERNQILSKRPASSVSGSRGTFNKILMEDAEARSPNDDSEPTTQLGQHSSPKETVRSGAALWILVATSRAFWPVYFCHVANNWTTYTLISEFPSFLKKEHGFSLSSAGFALVGMYICQSLGSSLGGIGADCMIRNGGDSSGGGEEESSQRTNNARVLFGEIAMLGSAFFLILAANQTSASVLVVLFMCAAVALLGCGSGSWRSSFVDLAPTQSAAAYTVSNTLANATGILTPLFTNALTSESARSQFGWKAVFMLPAAINVLAGLCWARFVTSSPIEGL